MKKTSSTKSNRLARKLKQIRLQLELSQNQILKRLGFADQLFRSNISQYERGYRVPSPPVLLAYARLANVDLATLIDDDLDLPKNIPRTTKSGGIQRSSRSRKTYKPPPPKRQGA
jgi:transcriptional regulator with XRE-family HTH domain